MAGTRAGRAAFASELCSLDADSYRRSVIQNVYSYLILKKIQMDWIFAHDSKHCRDVVTRNLVELRKQDH